MSGGSSVQYGSISQNDRWAKPTSQKPSVTLRRKSSCTHLLGRRWGVEDAAARPGSEREGAERGEGGSSRLAEG
tara:strand:- start:107 stop:328 length:222 start_codon:yes stop_codon:yes gene_type:complete